MPDSAVQSGRIASARNALAMAVQDLSAMAQSGINLTDNTIPTAQVLSLLQKMYADVSEDVRRQVDALCAQHTVELPDNRQVSGTPLAVRLDLLQYVLRL
jgi:hypothetical protein